MTFEEWAEDNGYSIEKLGRDYLSPSTAAAYDGWKARIGVENETLSRYGICEACLTHYRPIDEVSMQCDCTIDARRDSFILNLIESNL